MPKAIRLAPSLVVLLLSCSALTNSVQAGWFSSDPKPADAPKTAAPAPAATLEDSIREAQQLRLAGKYSEAINHLSQMMLVAADDGRVISEYGKTLVSMGRAEEGQKFLTRAQQLLPNDWSVYSALGVAYDQTGNQQEARNNYEHALALQPDEPSVLSNYAFSRMLAKDPAGARKLADRAEAANAVAPDAKITRNIAMIRSMAPQTDNFAVNTPAPVAAPHVPVAQAQLPAPAQQVAGPVPHVQTQADRSPAMASSAQPAPVAASAQVQAQRQVQQPRGVVMQPVPVDPLAGPVATRAPRSLASRAEANKVVAAKPAVTATPAARVSVPVKAADVKPISAPAAPRVLPPEGVKAADAKPATAKTAAAKPASKDAIPGLRLSANAY